MKTFETFETDPGKCPVCGYRPNRATFSHGFPIPGPAAKPEAGDVSLCWNCGAVNIFTDDRGNLRRPTISERKEMARDSRLQKMLQGIKHLHSLKLKEKFQ